MEKWLMFVLTHSAIFNKCLQRAVLVEGSQRSIIPLSIPTIWKERSGKNERKGT